MFAPPTVIYTHGPGLTTISTIVQLYRGVNFIGGGDQSIWRKTTDLPQVTDKLYHIMLYGVHLAGAGFELTKLVVIHVGTDCIGSCKSNYHTITTTTALNNIIDDCKSHRSSNTMDNIRYQSCKVGYGVLENRCTCQQVRR